MLKAFSAFWARPVAAEAAPSCGASGCQRARYLDHPVYDDRRTTRSLAASRYMLTLTCACPCTKRHAGLKV